MIKIKLKIIISSRPELIRLSKIINKAKEFFEVTHIYTNQNYDASLSTQFFDEFNIKPDVIYKNENKLSGNYFIANCMKFLTDYLQNNKTDAILILGDTNGAFATASVAKRLGIPIFHMEAFNRCWDIKRVPEEINRRQIDAISDYHLCYTQHSKQNGINEGHHIKNIYVIGNPIYEIIKKYDLQKCGVDNYYVATIHRKENIDNDERLEQILYELNDLNYKVKLSAHPSLMSKISYIDLKDTFKNIEFFTPSNHKDFLQLCINSRCVISDSGTVQEENYILNIPSVLLRLSTERPEIKEYNGVVKIVKPENITLGIKKAMKRNKKIRNINNDYHDEVSDNVINVLMEML